MFRYAAFIFEWVNGLASFYRSILNMQQLYLFFCYMVQYNIILHFNQNNKMTITNPCSYIYRCMLHVYIKICQGQL